MESQEDVDALLTESEKVDESRHEDLSHFSASDESESSSSESESALQNDLASPSQELSPVDDLMQEDEGNGDYPYTITQDQWNRRAARQRKQESLIAQDHAREKAHTPPLQDKYADPSAVDRIDAELSVFDAKNEKQHPEVMALRKKRVTKERLARLGFGSLGASSGEEEEPSAGGNSAATSWKPIVTPHRFGRAEDDGGMGYGPPSDPDEATEESQMFFTTSF